MVKLAASKLPNTAIYLITVHLERKKKGLLIKSMRWVGKTLENMELIALIVAWMVFLRRT